MTLERDPWFAAVVRGGVPRPLSRTRRPGGAPAGRLRARAPRAVRAGRPHAIPGPRLRDGPARRRAPGRPRAASWASTSPSGSSSRPAGGARGRPRPLWVRADMRQLPFRAGTFGAVVNFFTSFGYFEDPAEDARVVREVARVLAPGGAFLSDVFNAERVVSTLAVREEKTVAGERVSIRRRYDPSSRRVEKEIEMGSGENRRVFRNAFGPTRSTSSGTCTARPRSRCVRRTGTSTARRSTGGSRRA